MKTFPKNAVISLLRRRSKEILASPAKIIGVTGSMGKTTAKNAIVHILQKKYKVLASPEGFNTEIGILLTLLGERESGFSSPVKWAQILARALTKDPEVPEIIVLEYGVDKPGDMDTLLRIARPDYSVLTNIAPVHLAEGQFKNLEDIAKEKGKLAKGMRKNGIALLNGENPSIQKIAEEILGKKIIFGSGENADFQVQTAKQEKNGISWEVISQEKKIEYFAPFFGTYHTSVLVPAIILGNLFGISLQECAEHLQDFCPSPGRGRILSGKNESVIWDSSYNSSPEATKSALKTLPNIPAKRRIALLGNMNELGDDTAKYHEELGEFAAENADLIFFVGKESESFSKGINAKKPLQIFRTAEEAGKYIASILQKDDLILVKGSQNGVFLERAIERVLENPEDRKFLCRQGEEWKRK